MNRRIYAAILPVLGFAVWAMATAVYAAKPTTDSQAPADRLRSSIAITRAEALTAIAIHRAAADAGIHGVPGLYHSAANTTKKVIKKVKFW